MAPITPHWVRPSHLDVQEVIINEAEFTTKSIAKVSLPPFALFAKMSLPPCTEADEPTYATVQMGKDRHLNLNSDLLYINHSCEPSLIFDTTNLDILVGPKGLKEGEELTFFYPSTEYSMAQPFDCLCGTPTCRGRISGARDMTDAQLEGVWLNGHIRELREEQKRTAASGVKPNGMHKGTSENGAVTAVAAAASTPSPAKSLATTNDETALALQDAVLQAEKMVEAARHALLSYVQQIDNAGTGGQRRGPTSRELSGEMGGDTTSIAV
ncbi:hypothetical protein B0H66DRAFT_332160 [Apodospora peruviana]|uniref:Post-SET domain-containing protein n=1 Tax=Apodospora peruviana TaxID=516989 RepID=A0AAE0HY88_9PEZI|nr:hypothetical protein B0H66DRAFT_332160 [Apodospora peruviana]